MATPSTCTYRSFINLNVCLYIPCLYAWWIPFSPQPYQFDLTQMVCGDEYFATVNPYATIDTLTNAFSPIIITLIINLLILIRVILLKRVTTTSTTSANNNKWRKNRRMIIQLTAICAITMIAWILYCVIILGEMYH
ncbi:unnamed protein product, partial [Didymodactylos carnosus]